MRAHEMVAERLARELSSSPRPSLPSIDALCSTHGVSYQTVRGALKLLADRGLVVCRQGRRARVVGARDAESEVPEQSWHELYLRICAEIGKGRLRVGEALPKSAYYVVTHKVSAHTVGMALKRLAREGLVHKVRRRWVVGPTEGRGEPRVAVAGYERVVLILMEDFAEWLDGRRGFLNNRFYEAFYGELDKRACRAVPASWTATPEGHAIAGGLDRIQRYIGSLGNRYAGTLVTSPDQESVLPRLARWIERLRSRWGPVVWFDERNEGGHLADHRPSRLSPFFRCYPDERAAVGCLVEAVAALGHKAVAVPSVGTPDTPPLRQAARRVDHVRGFLADHTPPLRAFDFRDEERGYQEGVWREAERRLFDPSVGSAWGDALKDAATLRLPGLLALVRDRAVTAVVAPTDAHAVRYWLALAAWGIRVPHDLSIVSFDNDRRMRHIPLATVDHDMEALGYRCAHILIGDLPLDVYGGPSIAASPWLVNYGSLGAVRGGRGSSG